MRARILDVAEGLFYAEGMRAISADRIIGAVGITMVTFYRYFGTKDDLVVAYLDRRSEREREGVAQVLDGWPHDSATVFAQLVTALGEDACAPGFRGCPFINAAAEYADPDHPVRQAVDRHRAWFRSMIEAQLAELRRGDIAILADELIMLRDGAMVSGYLGRPQAVPTALRRAVDAVLASAI